MRTSIVCIAALMVALVANPVVVLADELTNHQYHNMSPIPINEGKEIVCKDADVSFGYYAYMHCTLHKEGTIKELLERTGGSCCEGEQIGGECRVTTIKYENGVPTAYLDGNWCEVTVKVHFDVTLPEGALAVVCASEPNISTLNSAEKDRPCPVTYCAAATAGL